MAKAAQKISATTQRFIEIQDIVDDIVLLPGGAACLILEVTATNFSLQSQGEQEAKILSYASLLNSLSFPVQTLIISRQLDISSYIKLLEEEATRAQNPVFANHIHQYKDFVADLVQKNTVLDKKFYIVLPYSFLEKGAGAAASSRSKEVVLQDAKSFLHGKAKSLIQELIRVGLKSKILGRNELVHLFYEIYNAEREGVNIAEGVDTPVVKGVLGGAK